MKKTSTLVVESFDYDTFETFPGFDNFEKKYKLRKTQYRSNFSFTDFEERDQAKLYLNEVGLKFKQYYSIELESEEELKNYPIVAIVFNTTKFPVIHENKGILTIGSKISKKHFHDDIGTKTLVFSREAMRLFESNCPNLKFKAIYNDNMTKDYYLTDNLKTIQNPRIYSGESSIELYENNTYHIRNNDGRFDYSDAAIEEIQQSKFLMEDSFCFEGKKYKSPYKSYLCSGEFAFELNNFCDMQKESNSFFIPTLKFL